MSKGEVIATLREVRDFLRGFRRATEFKTFLRDAIQRSMPYQSEDERRGLVLLLAIDDRTTPWIAGVVGDDPRLLDDCRRDYLRDLELIIAEHESGGRTPPDHSNRSKRWSEPLTKTTLADELNWTRATLDKRIKTETERGNPIVIGNGQKWQFDLDAEIFQPIASKYTPKT